MKKRISGEQRRQKVLRLLQSYPEKFTIKEIIDYYRTTTGEVLNRNSLRKTLRALVLDGMVHVTSDKRGKAMYYATTIFEVYQKIISTMQSGDKDLFDRISRSIVPEVSQYETQDLSTGNILEFLNREVPTLYPLSKINYGDEGDLQNKTTIIIENTGGKNIIHVSPCLCYGDKNLISCCIFVSSVLQVAISQLIKEKCEVNWKSRQYERCSFDLNIDIQISGDEQRKHMDLNDPHNRERVIPGLE